MQRKNSNEEAGPTVPLPDSVRKLYRAHQALVKDYGHHDLKFTLDGRLVGDIGEALARALFGLVPTNGRVKGVDSKTPTDETVQVKVTGRRNAGPAYSYGQASAKYLLFFRLDFERNTAEIAYNGPEGPVRKHLPTGNSWSTHTIPLDTIRALAADVVRSNQLLRVKRSVTRGRTRTQVSPSIRRGRWARS
jgi:hypothetical protein